MDQLLLGTILFTLLTLLSPTIFVYYALFAALRVAILLFFASIEILIAFLNHFPLFALALRIKDPARIPGSIYFELSTGRPKPLLVLKVSAMVEQCLSPLLSAEPTPTPCHHLFPIQ